MASTLTIHGFDIAENRLQLASEAGVVRFDSGRLAAKGVAAEHLYLLGQAQGLGAADDSAVIRGGQCAVGTTTSRWITAAVDISA